MKTRYASTGFKPVEADSMSDAARPSGRNETTGHNIHFTVAVSFPPGVRAVRTGEAAIRLAETTGTQLYCYANPVDDGGPVTLDRAREIAKEDANLIYAHETY